MGPGLRLGPAHIQPGNGRMPNHLHHGAIRVFTIKTASAIPMSTGGSSQDYIVGFQICVPFVHRRFPVDDEADMVQFLAAATIDSNLP